MTTSPGKYAFSVDRKRRMLTIRFSGFFGGGEQLSSYADGKDDALARLGCLPNDHVTLCDFTACGPQSAEVLELFRASLDDPATRSRRIAVVVATALARMQFRRIVTRPDAACFDSVEEAEAWLMDAPGRTRAHEIARARPGAGDGG